MMITDGGRKAKKERESVFTAGIRYAGNVEKKPLSIRTIWDTSWKSWMNIWAALAWWVWENFPVWIRFWKKKFPLFNRGTVTPSKAAILRIHAYTAAHCRVETMWWRIRMRSWMNLCFIMIWKSIMTEQSGWRTTVH